MRSGTSMRREELRGWDGMPCVTPIPPAGDPGLHNLSVIGQQCATQGLEGIMRGTKHSPYPPSFLIPDAYEGLVEQAPAEPLTSGYRVSPTLGKATVLEPDFGSPRQCGCQIYLRSLGVWRQSSASCGNVGVDPVKLRSIARTHKISADFPHRT